VKLNLYVPEADFAPLVARFQRGKDRRAATAAMVKDGARVTLSPVVRAAATEIVPIQRRRREVVEEFNADYVFRGEILAGVKDPVKEASPVMKKVWAFVLDAGFHLRLDVRDVPLEDPFDPTNVWTEGPKFHLGDHVEFVGTLEGLSPHPVPPFTSALSGTTKDVVPIARGIGVFLTLEVEEATPYRLVPPPGGGPDLLTQEEPAPSVGGRRERTL
jgi:hypothetical protein